MIEVTEVGNVTVLKMDVVRMNPTRVAKIQEFCESSSSAIACNAFAYTVGDDIDRVELWAGDGIQRESFVQCLKHELNS